MPLTSIAKELIERPLPPEKIKKRPGKAGATYDYVTPDFVISLLNEAFDYKWNTRVVSHEMCGDTAVVVLELTVYDEAGFPISKQQFGSGEVSRGMGHGEAFKSAASDALKKAATLLGVALELYLDDEVPTEGGFRRPTAPPPSLRTPPPTSGPPKAPLAVPTSPAPPAAVPAPPAPPAAVPAPTALPKPANPFANNGNRTAASVPKPVTPAPLATPAPPAAPPPPLSAPAVKSNPFASKNEALGPNPTQMNALVNLSGRKELSQIDMIALVTDPPIADEMGNPKQAFEDLTHAEAIKVIKASQL